MGNCTRKTECDAETCKENRAELAVDRRNDNAAKRTPNHPKYDNSDKQLQAWLGIRRVSFRRCHERPNV